METIPLSQFFVSTERNKNSDFSAIKWLNGVDKVILERIIYSSELFFKIDEDENPEFECFDYLTLCYMIAEKECGVESDQLSEEIKHNCLVGLATFSYCEKLRREGIIKITGSGKVTESNGTDIELTEIGKVLGSSMKTMMDISNAVEKH